MFFHCPNTHTHTPSVAHAFMHAYMLSMHSFWNIRVVHTAYCIVYGRIQVRFRVFNKKKSETYTLTAAAAAAAQNVASSALQYNDPNARYIWVLTCELVNSTASQCYSEKKRETNCKVGPHFSTWKPKSITPCKLWHVCVCECYVHSLIVW